VNNIYTLLWNVTVDPDGLSTGFQASDLDRCKVIISPGFEIRNMEVIR